MKKNLADMRIDVLIRDINMVRKEILELQKRELKIMKEIHTVVRDGVLSK